MTLLGAVLAGGQSRRFGGDKAMALLGGRPLIAHAVAALATQADAVVVCGRDWGNGLPDRPAPGLGPLGGINAALRFAADRAFDAVLSVPCDTPVLPPDLAARLAGGGYAAEMPVVGLWPAGLADHLDRWLRDSADRSVKGWARAAGIEPIPLGVPLANVNTVTDLQAAERARGEAIER